MNPTDSQLERLFRAAARAPESFPAQPSLSLELQLLAAGPADAPKPPMPLLPLMRRALLCACAILLVTAALTAHSLWDAPPNELVIVDSVIRLSLMQ